MSDKLEQELRKALRPVEPPPGFVERVLARAESEGGIARGTPRIDWFGMAGWRWAAASALCVALAASAVVYQHERQKQGEAAKEQLMLALRITSSKLQLASEGVREIASPEQGQE